ncbi:glycosyltransferase family 4 protein [Sediminibacterium goheungense]|uniref:Glycosyltransferase involved in cell wall biosynthesis n=1 Tax=Sediminibacterium goheungense TaxID=1086393 RepID=A0A4R6IW60_9BACT|nr:glycosyltransferase family 4 protein [Sediminibacterium goheungense]TDO26924.1 glycosyltransferase involved in cell wall biosynthesis [Sediminibacterium goheungense]
MKKILYLSFYFEPDLCAGSFRNSPLARELAKQLEGKAIVDVITTVPNRYSSFSVEAPQDEHNGNLRIRRIILPSHKSGFIDQIKAFYHYYKEVMEKIQYTEYDLVVASSSRLFTAYLGYKIASNKKIPLYLDIRDIFTDTVNDVISNSFVKMFLLPVLRKIESKVFNYASHINLISAGFKGYFSKYTQPNYSYYTNGIDQEFIQFSNFEELLNSSHIVITYAGNIGEGQGLHKIIPQAAKQLGVGYHFRVIGDGGARKLLEEAILQEQVSNVSIEKPVKRTELLEIYKRSHYLLMHLNDYTAFEKVLPSKVFELGAFPRPVIAGVNGYARFFIEQYVSNVILVHPAAPNELVEKVRNYSYHIENREDFIQSFSRKQINAEMAASISNYL